MLISLSHPSPPQNRGREEEATADFQLVQAAYAVLSDVQERAWYDNHREMILRGGAPGEDGEGLHEGVDVMAFFSASAFRGYGDDVNSFFAVFTELFDQISADECDVAGRDVGLPGFGKSTSSFDEVGARLFAACLTWLRSRQPRGGYGRTMPRVLCALSFSFKTDAGCRAFLRAVGRFCDQPAISFAGQVGHPRGRWRGATQRCAPSRTTS